MNVILKGLPRILSKTLYDKPGIFLFVLECLLALVCRFRTDLSWFYLIYGIHTCKGFYDTQKLLFHVKQYGLSVSIIPESPSCVSRETIHSHSLWYGDSGLDTFSMFHVKHRRLFRIDKATWWYGASLFHVKHSQPGDRCLIRRNVSRETVLPYEHTCLMPRYYIDACSDFPLSCCLCVFWKNSLDFLLSIAFQLQRAAPGALSSPQGGSYHKVSSVFAKGWQRTYRSPGPVCFLFCCSR